MKIKANDSNYMNEVEYQMVQMLEELGAMISEVSHQVERLHYDPSGATPDMLETLKFVLGDAASASDYLHSIEYELGRTS